MSSTGTGLASASVVAAAPLTTVEECQVMVEDEGGLGSFTVDVLLMHMKETCYVWIGKAADNDPSSMSANIGQMCNLSVSMATRYAV